VVVVEGVDSAGLICGEHLAKAGLKNVDIRRRECRTRRKLAGMLTERAY